MTNRPSPPNRTFANRLPGFVSSRPLQLRALLALAAAMLAALVGAFGTSAMAVLPRTGLWLALLGWNWLKWELWFAWWLRRGFDWKPIVALGCVVLLLPLPFEVALGLRTFAGQGPASLTGVYLGGLGLSLLMVAVLVIARVWLGRQPTSPVPEPLARFPGTAVRIDELVAILAEDHYVRLHLKSGVSHLLHYRFGDAVAAVSSVPGQQVHRGAWIADAHRGTARRQGERWMIPAGPDLQVAVSRSHVARLRQLGWIGTRRSPANRGDSVESPILGSRRA